MEMYVKLSGRHYWFLHRGLCLSEVLGKEPDDALRASDSEKQADGYDLEGLNLEVVIDEDTAKEQHIIVIADGIMTDQGSRLDICETVGSYPTSDVPFIWIDKWRQATDYYARDNVEGEFDVGKLNLLIEMRSINGLEHRVLRNLSYDGEHLAQVFGEDDGDLEDISSMLILHGRPYNEPLNNFDFAPTMHNLFYHEGNSYKAEIVRDGDDLEIEVDENAVYDVNGRFKCRASRADTEADCHPAPRNWKYEDEYFSLELDVRTGEFVE